MESFFQPMLRFSSICSACRHRLSLKCPPRLFQSHSPHLRSLTTSSTPIFSPADDSALSSLSRALDKRSSAPAPDRRKALSLTRPWYPPKPHHLHISATKHNTHITLTTGARNAIISLSTGDLNFRKSNRGTYDAAYQLGVYALAQIKNKGLYSEGCDPRIGPIRSLEVIWRDFGPGRDAVEKVLLGADARLLRARVLRVMDGTRLKFGGTRSKKQRRLG